MIKNYRDFQVRIKSHGQMLAINFECWPGSASLPYDIPVPPAHPFPDWKTTDLDRARLAELGHALYSSVFVEEVASSFQAYVSQKGHEEGVRVSVRAHSSVLRGMLWEALCSDLVPAANYLALDPRTPVVRAATGPPWYPREMRLPPKLLAVLSSPRFLRIDSRKEKEMLGQALGKAVEKGLLEVDYLGFDTATEANFERLQEHLAAQAERYDIVHIIGHGLLEAEEEGLVALVEPGDGRQQDVDASDLANLFRSRGVILVILQACQSGAVDPSALYFSGVAQQLVTSGVPAVLAMQENIDQDVARHFMKILYARWLGDQCLFEDALTQARQSVRRKFKDRVESWAIPVFHIRPGIQLLPSRAEEPVRPVKERQVDAALPQQTRVNRETELLVLIRTLGSSGLRDMLDAQPQDFDATPEDVRTSYVFDAVFPEDEQTGTVLPGTVRVTVETRDFLLRRSDETVQIRPQGDSVFCVFPLTPTRVGTARLVVRVVDTSEQQVTLAQLPLRTKVRSADSAFETEYGVADASQEAYALTKVADAHARAGDPRQAIKLHAEALKIHREIGHPQKEAYTLTEMAIAYAQSGDSQRAIELYAQALEIHREIGDRRREANTLIYMGRAYAQLGDFRRAIELYAPALQIHRETWNLQGQAYTLTYMGQAYAQLGEARRAVEHYLPALYIARRLEDYQLAEEAQRGLWTEALRQHEETGDASAEQLRSWLAEIKQDLVAQEAAEETGVAWEFAEEEAAEDIVAWEVAAEEAAEEIGVAWEVAEEEAEDADNWAEAEE